MPRYIIVICVLLFLVIVIGPLLLIAAEVFLPAGSALQVLMLSARQAILLKNSLFIGVGTALFASLIGVCLGFLISRTDLPFKDFFLIFFIMPLFMPAHITAIGWIKFLNICGLSGNNFFYGWPGVVMVLGLAYFPFIMILTLSGLNSVDRRMEEAAALVRSRKDIIFRITLPLAGPYIFSGAILVFIFSVSDYGVPDLLRLNTYPVEIFVQFSAFYDTSRAVMLAVPLVMICLSLLFLQRRLMANRSYVVLQSPRVEKMFFSLNGWKMTAVIFCGLIGIVAVVFPLIMLIAGAGGFATYAAAFKTAHAQIENSLVFSALSASFICLIAFPLGYALARSGKKMSLFIDFFSIIPFAIPAAIFGVAMIRFWNWPLTECIYRTFIVLIFGYTARFAAFAVRAISSNIAQIHRNLEESAELACGAWLRRLRRVFLPLAWPGIAVSWVLCFALCMGELGLTLLVIPAGEATLPIRIYTLMHYGAQKLVCGLSVILLMITIIPAGILYLIYNIYRRKTITEDNI